VSNTVPNNVNVYQDTPNQVLIDQDAPNQVIVRTGGAAGNTRRFVYSQSTPSATWVITHTLGGKPVVVIVDSADTYVIGEVRYNSTSQITVSFTAPFSGFAYLT
jgi:hypothetical protein